MNRVRVISWSALVLAAAVVVYLIASSGTSGYTVYAEFHDVDGLRQGATVKVAGVPGGLVTNLTVTRRGTAMATLTLDPGAAPIGTGASVVVRPTDLLGEHYAQLNVGDLNRPLPSGSYIPISRTSVPVDLDQVLNTLNVDVRTRLRILINEAGIALDGRGANFNELLNQLPPDLTQASTMLGQIANENGTLRNLINEGDQITRAVDLKRNDMGQVITTGEQALQSVAIKQAQLSQTLQAAPAGLTQLRSTLQQLQSASAALIPAASELQATAPALTGTLKQLPPLAAAADPTLVTARQVAPALERLGRQGQAPLEALRPTASAIQGIASSAAPILSELDSRAMRDVLWFVENWALGTKGRDNLGHFVGADLEIDPSIITSALASFLNDNTPPLGSAQRQNHPVSSSGKPTVSLPGLNSTLSNTAGTVSRTVSGVSGLLNGTTQGLQKTLGAVGSAVSGVIGGLAKGGHSPSNTTTQSSGSGSGGSVQNLLNFLLGK